MIRCHVIECKYYDDGGCGLPDGPTMDYTFGCLLPPVCASFEEREQEDADDD